MRCWSISLLLIPVLVGCGSVQVRYDPSSQSTPASPTTTENEQAKQACQSELAKTAPNAEIKGFTRVTNATGSEVNGEFTSNGTRGKFACTLTEDNPPKVTVSVK